MSIFFFNLCYENVNIFTFRKGPMDVAKQKEDPHIVWAVFCVVYLFIAYLW
jgi:hypothetical protein